MIALSNRRSWQQEFQNFIPLIQRQAERTFSYLSAESRQDAVQEVVVAAMLAYRRLCELGKADLAYPRVLARYAICRYHEGRRAGTRMNCKDVTSAYCRRRNRLSVESLDRFDPCCDGWQEVLVEDRYAGPAETAATRIDFADWMGSLSTRKRRIAEQLARGESTSDVAKQFSVARSRISQVRRELEYSWLEFQGGNNPEVSNYQAAH